MAVVDVCVGRLGDYLQAHAKGGETKRTNDLAVRECHDIIVLGSSRAHHHYDTPFMSDTLGLDVYNAGYDGNGVVLAYGFLEMILERYQPRLVLFDIEPAFDINVYEPDNSHIRYIGHLKPYYQHAAVANVIRDVSKEEWYKVGFGMLRYNCSIISKGLDFLTNNNDMKGFEPLFGEYQLPTDINADNNEGVKDLDLFKIEYLKKLIELAKSNNIPIVFVASPKYGSQSSVFLKPALDICNNHDVPFVDFYSDQEFMSHPEWFKEPMHLNRTGAREYSKRIIPTIINYLQ